MESPATGRRGDLMTPAGRRLRGGRFSLKQKALPCGKAFLLAGHKGRQEVQQRWLRPEQNRRCGMTDVWLHAALWLELALLATLISIWLRIATALSEIVVGTVAQLIIGIIAGTAFLGADEPWIKFLSGTGAIVLTFLAGAELDPVVFRLKWKEATWLGMVGFALPFLGCAAVAYWLLGWEPQAAWLAGVALSTTSVAVV
jgi:sodium/hydrogen exchanger family protein